MDRPPRATLTGFGNTHESEAVAGALPTRNTPRRPPLGLYAEQLNGTPFTVRRPTNLRTWMYRVRPAIPCTPWTEVTSARWLGRFDATAGSPEIMRHRPHPYPEGDVDFVAGMSTFAGAGDPDLRVGFAVHVYAATCDMRRAFANVDGDLIIAPQEGSIDVQTELGWLRAAPGHVLLIPRGLRFRVDVLDGRARGFVGELLEGHFRLPDRGVIGANGLAHERHFHAPTAAFDDVGDEVTTEIVHKHGGRLWRAEQRGTPFDVVAWHGRYAPYRFDLMDFAAYGGVVHDHSDPSVHTVLTAPHDDHGRNAADLVVFRGRWDATEDTYRPPFMHRNAATEFNAVVRTRTAKGPWTAGTTTFTPVLSPHGISAAGHARVMAQADTNAPRRHADDELWIQFESMYTLHATPWTREAAHRDHDYLRGFAGYPPARTD